VPVAGRPAPTHTHTRRVKLRAYYTVAVTALAGVLLVVPFSGEKSPTGHRQLEHWQCTESVVALPLALLSDNLNVQADSERSALVLQLEARGRSGLA
jgi:hypothetical protein